MADAAFVDPGLDGVCMMPTYSTYAYENAGTTQVTIWGGPHHGVTGVVGGKFHRPDGTVIDNSGWNAVVAFARRYGAYYRKRLY